VYKSAHPVFNLSRTAITSPFKLSDADLDHVYKVKGGDVITVLEREYKLGAPMCTLRQLANIDPTDLSPAIRFPPFSRN
jgi:hypothetical protein